ncbi:sensor histidine kinase [Leuconostoc citreum]|uniref:sensor histidine kinase n=1 Tax=Leuconostoc citreum TaxID=33964 RepID=UPI0022E6E6E1|nr:sensor histidine kinase [Leuconostoc citreum]
MSTVKLYAKISISEWPIILAYSLLMLLLSFLGYLYKIDLVIIIDLIRYSIIPLLIIVSTRIYQKIIDTKQVQKAIIEQKATNIKMHGFYGQLYAKTLTTFMNKAQADNRQLIEAFKERQDYLTLWSHEMKTPLTTLTLAAENNTVVPSDLVSEKADLLTYHIEQLLTIDRLADFNKDLYFEYISLSTCVTDVVKQNTSYFLSHKVVPIITLPEVMVLSDQKWLCVMLTQLISNAIKYSPQNSRIALTFDDHTLWIKDFGVGISQSDLPRIFDQGFTGTNGRLNNEATGMGLYIVQQIAAILDIQVTIQSYQQKGTSVAVQFNPKKLKYNKL